MADEIKANVMGEIFASDKAIVIDEVIAVMLQSMRPMIPMRLMISTQLTRQIQPTRPLNEANVFVKAVGDSVPGNVHRAKEADADKADKEQ